jgi:O-antigen/teichoic acid export membrane protein
MAALLVPVSLANMMLTMGLPESLGWHTAQGLLATRKACHIALWGGLVCGLFGAIILLLLGPLLLRGEAIAYIGGYQIIVFTLPITLAIAGLRGVVLGRQGFGFVNSERVAGMAIRFAALLTLLVSGLLDPEVAAWTSVLSGIAGSVFLIPMLYRRGEQPCVSIGVSKVVKYARATALGTIGGFLTVRLDQTLMIPLSGAEQLGYYAVAASLAELPLAAVAAIADLTFSIGTQRDLSDFAAQACRMTLFVLVPMCALAAIIAPLTVPLFFGRDFAPVVPMAQILFVGTLASSVSGLLGAGLMSMGHTVSRSYAQVSGAVLTVMLIAFLVPRYGGIGAAWATALTYLWVALVTTIAYTRYSRISVRDCFVPSATELGIIVERMRRRTRARLPRSRGHDG